jgi:ribosomal peptide maturation radical SAM protein 1
VKVLLVVAPFAAIERPALGVSVVKSRLAQAGILCDIAYLNLAFADLFGWHDYERLVWDLPFRALVGEWVFTGCLYGPDAPKVEAYVTDILRGRWGLAEHEVQLALDARRVAPQFLATAVEPMPWADYEVVGFSSYTAQNVAALAIARRVKSRHPNTTIVFGGANWQGESGVALFRRFGFVDFVCQGDAETSFLELLRWLKRRTISEPRDVGGIVYRRAGGGVVTTPGAPTRDLDALPPPDFTDFYADLRRYPGAGRRLPQLSAETSRGCWWAQTGPCGFCGMDAQDREYRSKSPGRVLDELRGLTRTWAGSMVYLADTVVPPSFLDEVLPALAERPLPIPLFCDVRPTVTREQVRLMGSAGIQIQPGIESFSDHVLRLMHKGTRGLENIRLLKWCAAYRVRVSWNILFGFPGETEQDYEEMLGMTPSIRFLPPPQACQTLSVDRSSPFFDDPTAHGFGELRPLAPYPYLYPFPDADLWDVAYAFDYACAPGLELPAVATRLRAEVAAWKRESGGGELRYGRDTDGALTLVDARPGRPRRKRRLGGIERAVYLACEEICSRRDLERHAAAFATDEATSALGIEAVLKSFVRDRLMVTQGDRYLSLALPDLSGRWPTPSD